MTNTRHKAIHYAFLGVMKQQTISEVLCARVSNQVLVQNLSHIHMKMSLIYMKMNLWLEHISISMV